MAACLVGRLHQLKQPTQEAGSTTCRQDASVGKGESLKALEHGQ